MKLLLINELNLEYIQNVTCFIMYLYGNLEVS